MDYKNLEIITWMVRQFHEAGKRGLTYDELIDKLVQSSALGTAFTKRTFHYYLNELRDRFGVKIECDRRSEFRNFRRRVSDNDRRYIYRLVEEPSNNKSPWPTSFLWALDAADAYKRIQEDDEVRKHIYVDCNSSGAENVAILLHAIRNHHCVDFNYRHPSDNFMYPNLDFEPRGLVMKDYVWYLIGNTASRFDKILPLFRISGIVEKELQYRSIPGFSVQKFWHNNRKLWFDNIT